MLNLRAYSCFIQSLKFCPSYTIPNEDRNHQLIKKIARMRKSVDKSIICSFTDHLWKKGLYAHFIHTYEGFI